MKLYFFKNRLKSLQINISLLIILQVLMLEGLKRLESLQINISLLIILQVLMLKGLKGSNLLFV